MIPLSLLIVALSIGFIHGLQKKNFEKKTTRSEFGKRLNGHVFMTAGGLDPQHCLADCWQVNDRCESFNFLVEEKVCELNNRSKENAPNNFTDRVGSVYCTNPAFGRGAVRLIICTTHVITHSLFLPVDRLEQVELASLNVVNCWQACTSELSLYIYGTLPPSYKSGKKWGKVSGPFAVCRSAHYVYICNM